MENCPPNRFTEQVDIPVNVLGYRKGMVWVAFARELDLRGYGKSFNEAYQELLGLIRRHLKSQLFDPEEAVRSPVKVTVRSLAAAQKLRLVNISKRVGTSDFQIREIDLPQRAKAAGV